MADETLDLRRARARHAYGYARALSNNTNLLPGFPVLLRTQGLVFGLACARKESSALAEALRTWLGRPARGTTSGWATSPLPAGSGESFQALMRGFLELDARSALVVEQEAVRYAETLKLVVRAAGDGEV